MSGWGSLGVNKQDSESQQSASSFTGLGGTRYARSAADNLYKSGQGVNEMTQRILGNTAKDPASYMNYGRLVLPGGRYGMGQNVDNAVAMFGRDMFNQTSSDMAQRGFSTPESQNAVVGSALQNASVQLIPQMMAFQQAQFMAPQTLQDTAIKQADFWNRTLGQRSKSQGTSESHGWGFQVAGGGGK